MPLTDVNIKDLSQYQVLLQNLNSILVGQSAIVDADRLLTDGNVTELNTVYTHVLDNIDIILTEAEDVPA